MGVKGLTPLRWMLKMAKMVHSVMHIFKGFYLFIFRERGRKGGREGEKQSVASCAPPTKDLAGNPGMCPARESNR